jgi:hypothetical protein
MLHWLFSWLFSWLERTRDPRPIALLRITLFCGVLVHFLPSLGALDVEYVPNAVRLRLHNGWLYDHLFAFPRWLVAALAVALVLATLLAIVGFATRAASAATMALTWTFASFNALPVQTIALLCAWSLIPVFAVFPGASSAWSLDAMIARRRKTPLPPTTMVANVSAFLVVAPFFGAGIEKLVVGWATTNEMAMLFRTPPGYILRDVAYHLPLEQEWFSAGIAWLTIGVELCAPVLLLFRRTRLLGLLLWLGLFAGIVALIEVPPLFFAIFFFGAFLFLDANEVDRMLCRHRWQLGQKNRASLALLAFVGAVLPWTVGCAPPPGGSPGDDDDELFAIDRAILVEITLGEQAFSDLRHEGHDVASVATRLCTGHPPADVYDWYPAHVRIDGVVHNDAEVRKKGFFGSDSDSKPSLKVRFPPRIGGESDESDETRTLTLNNAVADPSLVRQCLAALVFSRASVPTPRCGFARVVIDGVDRGIYVHVESLKEPFFLRAMAGETGVLFEGRLADFRPGMESLFEGKDLGNTQPPIPTVDPNVVALTQALADPQESLLLPALDAVLDVDEFLRFWAVEVLVAQVDGYTNNRNNFAVWHRANGGKLQFIPWGLDETFENRGTLQAKASPFASVMARGRLARRLFLHPEGRARFEASLRQMLDVAWDEPTLFAALDGMQQTLRREHGKDDNKRIARAIERTRSFVQERRGAVMRELSSEDIVWSESEPPPVCVDAGAVDVTFTATTATEDEALQGQGQGQGESAIRAYRDREGRFVVDVPLDEAHGRRSNDEPPDGKEADTPVPPRAPTEPGAAARRILHLVAPWSALVPGESLPLQGEPGGATAMVVDVLTDVADDATRSPTPTVTRPVGVVFGGALDVTAARRSGSRETFEARLVGRIGCVALLGGPCGGVASDAAVAATAAE